MRNLYYFLFFCIPTILLGNSSQTLAQHLAINFTSNDTISVSHLNKVLSNKNTLLLDLRGNEAQQISKIPHAHLVNADHLNIGPLLNNPDNTLIVLYSTIGENCSAVKAILTQQGYQNVKIVYGGIVAWINKGNTLVSSKGNLSYQIHLEDIPNKNWLANPKYFVVN